MVGGRKRAGGKTAAARAKKVPGRWTAQKQADFIAELGRSCNVSKSARAVGMSESSVYRQRVRSPAFRVAWEAALRAAYQRLEMMLLQRALAAATASGEAAGDEKIRACSDTVALKLLAAHRALATRPVAPPDEGAPSRSARERLKAKLAEMSERMAAGD